MNTNNDKRFEENISRLVKLMQDSQRPSDAFTESLISNAAKMIDLKKDALTKPTWTGKRIAIITGAAAVILIAVGLFTTIHTPKKSIDNTPTAALEQSSKIFTVAHLNVVYNRAGIQGLNEYLEQTVSKTGPRPDKLTVEDMFAELNGG